MAEIRMERGLVKWSAEGSESFVTKEREVAMDFFKSPVGSTLIGAAVGPMTGFTSPVKVGASLHSWKSQPLDLDALKRVVDEGQGPQVLHLKDEITVTLTKGTPATAVCEGFYRDRPYFVFRDCLGKGKMNASGGNKGGYYGSDGRAYVLDDLYNLLPPELKKIIMPRELVEVIDGEEKRYSDPLWVPSATDVFGPRTPDSRWWAEEPDSFWLPGFKRERDRVKECLDDPDYGTCYWWLRSPYAGNANFFCPVGANGTADNGVAYYSNGFAPGFCV